MVSVCGFRRLEFQEESLLQSVWVWRQEKTKGSVRQGVCVCVCVCVLSCVSTLCNPMDCSLPDSSVRGISQARILEWVAISSSRGSSPPRDWTPVSCICRRILLPLAPPRKPSQAGWVLSYSGEGEAFWFIQAFNWWDESWRAVYPKNPHGNTQNVWPDIWAPHGPVKLTQKIDYHIPQISSLCQVFDLGLILPPTPFLFHHLAGSFCNVAHFLQP